MKSSAKKFGSLTRTHWHKGVRIIEDRLTPNDAVDFSVWSIEGDPAPHDSWPKSFSTLLAAVAFVDRRLTHVAHLRSGN